MPEPSVDAPKMTRQQMKDILDRGESVMHNSRIIASYDDLPDEVEMAKQTPGQVQAVLAQKLQELAENEKIIAALREAAKAELTPEGTPTEPASASGFETAETGAEGQPSKDALGAPVKRTQVGIKPTP